MDLKNNASFSNYAYLEYLSEECVEKLVHVVLLLYLVVSSICTGTLAREESCKALLR